MNSDQLQQIIEKIALNNVSKKMKKINKFLCGNQDHKYEN